MEAVSVFAKGLFVGRTVLITGGGTGIGLATARLLGGLGARVVLCARTQPRLEEAAQSLRDRGIEACGRAVDIRKEHSIDSLFAGLLADGWFPDSLINNAGGQFAAPALDITPNGFRAVVDLNLTGSWLMSVAFARHFRALGQSSGSIVSIVLAQASGMPGMVHAAAARAGVVNMMKTLAYEWGPFGLTANAIAPGTVDTPALKGYDPASLALGVARLPIKRMAQADEIAQAIAFLISKAGRFITGTVLEIDGGEHLTGAFCQNSVES